MSDAVPRPRRPMGNRVDDEIELRGATRSYALAGWVRRYFVFASGEAGAEQKILEGVATEDAMDDDAEFVALEINAVIAKAKAVEGFAVPLEFG